MASTGARWRGVRRVDWNERPSVSGRLQVDSGHAQRAGNDDFPVVRVAEPRWLLEEHRSTSPCNQERYPVGFVDLASGIQRRQGREEVFMSGGHQVDTVPVQFRKIGITHAGLAKSPDENGGR